MAFQPVVKIQSLQGGVRTDDFFDNLTEVESPEIIGMDIEKTKPVKTPGFVEFGTDDSTEVYSRAFNHRILSNIEVLTKFGIRAKFYDTITEKYLLFSTKEDFDADAGWWFATFNSYLFCGNEVDGFFRWKAGAWSTLTNPVTAASTTIDLATGEGARFDLSGTGLIEGDSFTWSGKSGDQLTGVSGLSASHTAGNRVITAMDVTTYSSNPKAKIGVFFANRLFLVDAENPNTIKFSVLADNTVPHDDLTDFSTSSGAGAAGFLILPAPVLGLQVFYNAGNNPVLIALAADGNSYSINVTDSGSTTVPTNPLFKPFNADLLGERLITITENSFVFVDNNNNLRSASYGEQNTVLNTIRISDGIQPSLDTYDISGGFMKYIDRRLFIHCKRTSGASTNNYTVVKDTHPDAYTFYDHWAFNDIVEWQNDYYGISAQTSQTFKLFTGDDANGDTYYCKMSISGLGFGENMILKTMKKIRHFGYMTVNATIYLRVYYDTDTEPAYVFEIKGDNQEITDTISGVSMGTVTLGGGVFGGGSSNSSEKFTAFKADLNLPPDRYFYTARIEIVNDEAGVSYKFDKLLLFAEMQDDELVDSNRNLTNI